MICLTPNPDTDWNYELGTKLGLANGKVQLNGDVYHILWSNVQSSQAPGGGCGDQFTTNAGHAVSQGLELSGQAIVIAPLTVNAAFGYDLRTTPRTPSRSTVRRDTRA
jgi:outer membrane receptor protein involved in Fe transport